MGALRDVQATVDLHDPLGGDPRNAWHPIFKQPLTKPAGHLLAALTLPPHRGAGSLVCVYAESVQSPRCLSGGRMGEMDET